MRPPWVTTEQTGHRARVYRALYLPRLVAGLPREVCAFYWGMWSIPILSWRIYWLLLVAIPLHGLIWFLGRKNPYWFPQLKRKWHHQDVYVRKVLHRNGERGDER
jgi:type IV secretory pathway VirB3-like protein